jgi:hypothetical protein
MVGLFFFSNGFTQATTVKFPADTGKNLIKLHFGSFLFKSANIQYERAIKKRMALGLSIRWMPKSSVAFSSSFSDDDEVMGSFKTGNFAITPEIRWYFGKKVFKGFYVAPFLRLANYSAATNYDFTVNGVKENIPLKGNLTTFTTGVLIGAQWRIANKVYFDWSIFGPHDGFSKGKITGTKTLSAEEQKSLKEELKDLENDMPIGKVSSNVDGNGATVNVSGPWAGIRANLGIGYRF